MKKTFVRILTLALVAVMTCGMLVSCGGPASDPDKAVKALEKNDYVAKNFDSDLAKLSFSWAGDVEAVVTGIKKGEAITIIYYEDASAAKDAWEKVEKHFDDENDDDSDFVIKRSGKMIYCGTKDAVKDAK